MNASMRELTTPRLILEPLEKRHAALMYDALRDERIYEFIPHVAVTTLEALTERFERIAGRRSPDGAQHWLTWAMRDRAHESEPRYLGYVQATIHLRSHEAWLGYALVPAAWGAGYAREAVLAMIDEIKRTHDIRTLTATVSVENARSNTLLARLGFAITREHDGDFEYARDC